MTEVFCAAAPRFVLIRHPRPHKAQGLCYGRKDLRPQASSLVRAQQLLAAALPKGLPMFSSPAIRCSALALGLIKPLRCPLWQEDADLWELNFGEWEGRLWAHIPQAAQNRWAADPWLLAPPGGECWQALYARVAAAHARMCAHPAVKAVGGAVVIAHQGSLRAFAAHHLGLPFAQARTLPFTYNRPLTLGADGLQRLYLADEAPVEAQQLPGQDISGAFRRD